MIYFVSDLHFGHKNIIKYEPNFRGKYKDVDEMNEDLIKQWNSLITKNDIVYNLGDFFFTLTVDKAEDILKRLRFKHMIFIIGNHDNNKMLNLFKKYNIELKYADLIKRDGFELYLSHYPTIIERRKVYNIHGHIHSKNYPSNYHINVGCDNLLNIGISLDEIMDNIKNGKYNDN